MLVGGTYTVDCLIVKVWLLVVTIPLVGNLRHADGLPLTLKGTYTTGTEGFPSSIESTG